MHALFECLVAQFNCYVRMNVTVFHGRYMPRAEAVSYRMFGASLVSVGLKQGAVDIALKDRCADLLLQAFKTRGGAALPMIVIVSGDADFAGDVRRLRHVGYDVVLVPNDIVPADLRNLATCSFPWSVVCKAAQYVAKLGVRRGATARADMSEGLGIDDVGEGGAADAVSASGSAT